MLSKRLWQTLTPTIKASQTNLSFFWIWHTSMAVYTQYEFYCLKILFAIY